jgi:hypothetical protein
MDARERFELVASNPELLLQLSGESDYKSIARLHFTARDRTQ